MQSSKKALAGLLVSLVVLAGCSRQPEAANPTSAPANTPSASQPAVSAATSSSATTGPLPLVHPTYPGPYKTVEINGVECRQGRDEPGKFGGTLVRSIVGSEPKVFNPWTAADTQSTELGGLMFSGLMGMDAYNGELFPDMARDLKIDPDGVTYTVTLRKGLKWSDGQPVTADDVTYTWNTIVAGGYGNSSMRDVTTVDGKSPEVTKVDDLTVKFVTPKPFAPFARLLSMPIAPKHIVMPVIQKPDGRARFQQLWAATNIDPKSLVTLGPFRLSRYVAGQRVEFVPATNYYVVDKNNKQLPYLAHLMYLIVPEVTTNLMKFKDKEIDLTPVRARDVVTLLSEQSSGDFKLYNLGQSQGSTFLAFNMNRRKNPKSGKPYVDPVKSAWFNDVNFRQAVNHAINRDAIVANYFKGIGFGLFTSESPASPWINKNLKGFPQDLNYAASLLQKSGFTKKDDGFLYDKDGNKVEFTLLAASGGTFYEALLNNITNDLKKLGMKVDSQMIDFNILIDKMNNSLDWEAAISGLGGGDPLEPNNSKNVYASDGRLHMFDQRLPDKSGKITVTDARPWEKRLDEIFNEGAETLDNTKRRALYDEYQKIVYDETPFIYLVSPMTIIGARNTIGNYIPTELSQSSFGLHNLEEIYKK